jgi:hypothetical protein
MTTWEVQRPATIWIKTKVKAETLEDALELADTELYNGEYMEDEESFTIDYSRYCAIDEYENLHTDDTEKAANA